MVNVLNHGGYSLFEPKEMVEENKKYFKQIFKNFKKNYKFNKNLFEITEVVEETPTVMAKATSAKKRTRPNKQVKKTK